MATIRNRTLSQTCKVCLGDNHQQHNEKYFLKTFTQFEEKKSSLKEQTEKYIFKSLKHSSVWVLFESVYRETVNLTIMYLFFMLPLKAAPRRCEIGHEKFSHRHGFATWPSADAFDLNLLRLGLSCLS